MLHPHLYNLAHLEYAIWMLQGQYPDVDAVSFELQTIGLTPRSESWHLRGLVLKVLFHWDEYPSDSFEGIIAVLELLKHPAFSGV